MSHRPPRLPVVFQRFDQPLYYVTFCTAHRRHLLDNDPTHDAFLAYARNGTQPHGVGVGRYVLMPDHVHLFVRGSPEFRLALWVRGLKRTLGDVLRAQGVNEPLWQEGFFDHLMRSDESYAQKWNYVRENPVRKGLVEAVAHWPYAGEIVRIDRA
jgi:putative transposase